MITVRSLGIATSVRDGGRRGLAHLGKSRGGAVDAWSPALANRLVGNPEAAPAWETSGLFSFTVDEPIMVAIAGAMVDATVEDGPPLGWGMAVALPAGATVRLGPVRDGLRAYVALGSGASAEAAVPRPPETTIRVWPGPRLDWFVPDAWLTLTSADYVVSADSNRVGARLGGAMLERLRREELLSEGLIEGAIQVPPDGQPIVMLADHPTTGGYPVIAVVDPADLRHVAQAAPGAALRFRAFGR